MINDKDIKVVTLSRVPPVPRLLPGYARKRVNPVTEAFVALGDEAARDIFEIDDTKFDHQLTEARNEHATVVGWVNGWGRTAFHFVGSTVHTCSRLQNRNLFVPTCRLKDPRHVNRVFVAYFVNANPAIEDISELSIAGWISRDSIIEGIENNDKPDTFNSSLDCVAVKINNLRPLSELPVVEIYPGAST